MKLLLTSAGVKNPSIQNALVELSAARPPEARRALPCTADNVVENTTLGSGFQSAAHSSSASSRRGQLSAAVLS